MKTTVGPPGWNAWIVPEDRTVVTGNGAVDSGGTSVGGRSLRAGGRR